MATANENSQTEIWKRQDLFIQKLDTAMTANHAVGYVIIGALGHNHDIKLYEDVDLKKQTEEEGRELRKSEIEKFHCIFLTIERQMILKSALNKVKHIKVDTEYERELGFVDPIVVDLNSMLGEANRSQQKMVSKFNNLFALTYAVAKHTHWMYDESFEWRFSSLSLFVQHLATAWSCALYYSDKALGIESEYTRPGVELLLDGLKAKFAHLPYAEVDSFEWDLYKEKNEERAENKKRKAEFDDVLTRLFNVAHPIV